MIEPLRTVVSSILGLEDKNSAGSSAKRLVPNLATANPALSGTNLQFEIDKAAQVSDKLSRSSSAAEHRSLA